MSVRLHLQSLCFCFNFHFLPHATADRQEIRACLRLRRSVWLGSTRSRLPSTYSESRNKPLRVYLDRVNSLTHNANIPREVSPAPGVWVFTLLTLPLRMCMHAEHAVSSTIAQKHSLCFNLYIPSPFPGIPKSACNDFSGPR